MEHMGQILSQGQTRGGCHCFDQGDSVGVDPALLPVGLKTGAHLPGMAMTIFKSLLGPVWALGFSVSQ